MSAVNPDDLSIDYPKCRPLQVFSLWPILQLIPLCLSIAVRWEKAAGAFLFLILRSGGGGGFISYSSIGHL